MIIIFLFKKINKIHFWKSDGKLYIPGPGDQLLI